MRSKARGRTVRAGVASCAVWFLMACGGEAEGPADAGREPTDAGAVSIDAGAPAVDAGGSELDASSLVADAGAADAAR